MRHQGGQREAPVPRYRLQAQQGRRAGQGRVTIEYDPNRSARIALLHYVDGEKRYILAPKGLKVGDTVISGAGADIKPGNAMPLSEIPVGTLIHAIEFQPGKGAAIARSAGTACQLMGKEGMHTIIRMPSSEMRRVLVTCRASIGKISNSRSAPTS